MHKGSGPCGGITPRMPAEGVNIACSGFVARASTSERVRPGNATHAREMLLVSFRHKNICSLARANAARFLSRKLPDRPSDASFLGEPCSPKGGHFAGKPKLLWWVSHLWTAQSNPEKNALSEDSKCHIRPVNGAALPTSSSCCLRVYVFFKAPHWEGAGTLG